MKERPAEPPPVRDPGGTAPETGGGAARQPGTGVSSFSGAARTSGKVSPLIVLTSDHPGSDPRSWSSPSILQIGRLPDLEVFLDHDSVSRRHAEVVLTEEGWVVRDLGSMNGTFLNAARLGRTHRRVRPGDVLKVGDLKLRVEQTLDPARQLQVGSRTVEVEASMRRPRLEAPGDLTGPGPRKSRDPDALLRLVRDAYRLASDGSLKPQMQRLLDEAVSYFGAQRGGILFVDSTGTLEVQCVSVCTEIPAPPRRVNIIPAARAFARKESLLFRDAPSFSELAAADSVARGVMASIVCSVIRSPGDAFGVLHLDRGPHQEPFTVSDLSNADAVAAALSVGVERLQLVERHRELLLQTVTGLAQAVEMRDRYTGGHTSRVTCYSLLLAEEIGLPDDQRQLLRGAGALHDIGKIAIDDHILRKAGRLSDAEFSQMKTHVIRGAEIIETMPGLAWALPVVRSHHERWDGQGYPDGLKGEEIPLTARVVAVADAFDAMTSDRPYRRGMPARVAFDEIRAGSGKQFDPRCADGFLRLREKIESLLNRENSLCEQAEGASKTITAAELRRQMVEEATGPSVQTPLPRKSGPWDTCRAAPG